MNTDTIFILAGIILAILAGYVITHDIFVYKAENDAIWQDRLFESYMANDCQALKDKINELETDDYWFNSPPVSLIKAKVLKCQGET